MQAVKIDSGQVLSPTTHILLTLETCNAKRLSSLVESGERTIKISIAAAHTTTLECAETLEIELDAPIGDRVIIDGSTGDTVPVLAP